MLEWSVFSSPPAVVGTFSWFIAWTHDASVGELKLLSQYLIYAAVVGELKFSGPPLVDKL